MENAYNTFATFLGLLKVKGGLTISIVSLKTKPILFKINTMKTERIKGQKDEELTRHIFQLESKLFRNTISYQLIEQNNSGKFFNSNEQKQLFSDVFSVYTKLINTIWVVCPSLTSEDIIYCCLTKHGLTNTEICCCMGSVNKQTVNQRKYRIKKKMLDVKREDLFNLIFELEGI